jgi:hypothetical protein
MTANLHGSMICASETGAEPGAKHVPIRFGEACRYCIGRGKVLYLRRRRKGRMGRSAQNLHSRSLVVQLGLSDQLLTNIEGYDGLGSKAQENDFEVRR